MFSTLLKEEVGFSAQFVSRQNILGEIQRKGGLLRLSPSDDDLGF